MGTKRIKPVKLLEPEQMAVAWRQFLRITEDSGDISENQPSSDQCGEGAEEQKGQHKEYAGCGGMIILSGYEDEAYRLPTSDELVQQAIQHIKKTSLQYNLDNQDLSQPDCAIIHLGPAW